ncbi:MAG: class I SAM-dependent methyltransferase [Proteobacteria bacterium]|nr:class I SAM-dependent methyltransferase [Pseudomonadota bacterium]
MEETVLLFNRMATKYDLWFEKEKLTFQIEERAFKSLFPFLRKPWLELGVGSGRFAKALEIPWGIDPAKNLLQIAKGRGIKVVAGRGESVPIFSEMIGSLFVIDTLCIVKFPKLLLQECHRVLMREGKIVIGFIPRGSPWGRFYLKKKKGSHSFCRLARFYSVGEVERLIIESGFSIQGIISTLFQKPEEVKNHEIPMKGYRPQAGFLVIVGERLG